MASITGLTRRAVCGAAAAALLFVPLDAHAHGGIPRAWGIIFEPGNPQHIVLRSDIYGIFQSLDAGKTWTYGCAELYGAKWQQATHVSVVLTPGGRTLVPSQSFENGKAVGIVMTEDLCTWRPSPDMAGKFVQDLTLNGSDLYLVTADGLNGGIVGQIYKSTDKGDHFTAQGKQLPTDFSGSSIYVAPNDPSRIYVLGELIDTGGQIAITEVSSDGGATWTRPADQTDPSVPQITKDSQAWTPRIYAVHPTRKDVVFAWADGLEGLGQNIPDEVWASADGAKTWKKIFSGQGDLPGFTFSPDGTKVYVSGPVDNGIFEASVDDALAQGQSAFTKIFEGQVWGLNWTADGLYAGNNDFTLNKKPTPFTLGVSHDEGKTFSQVMTLCDVKFATCDESSYGLLCSPSWTIPGSTPGQGGYKEDYLEGDRCVGSSPKGDGGTAPPAASSDSGGCEFAPRTSGTGVAYGAALLALGLGSRLRRKRR